MGNFLTSYGLLNPSAFAEGFSSKQNACLILGRSYANFNQLGKDSL